VGITDSPKSRAATTPTSKSWRTQRRPANAATLHRHPIGVNTSSLQRRRFLHLAAGAATLPAASRMAWPQAYPSRPITIIVPSAAGGPGDVVGRVAAERMKRSLGQPIIIENVSGASGSIGTGRVARTTADGYTVIIGNWGTHVVNGAIYRLQYDVVKDFEPISLFSSYPLLIVAKNGVPATDLTGLIAWLKANPNRASAGIVVPAFSYFFQSLTGTQFQLISYRGTAPAMQDLVAGNIDMMFADPTTSLPQVRAGHIKAFAVMSMSRLTSAPDIPTVDEAGLPGFYGSFWIGLWAPQGTPRDIISKLNAAAVDALADATVGARLADIGHEIFCRNEQTPEALAALQKAEIEKWWPIFQAAGVKVQ
jgi:tripartite-type tricarboxylate transporter receptor subunit TctC